jgi:hypothetical protein
MLVMEGTKARSAGDRSVRLYWNRRSAVVKDAGSELRWRWEYRSWTGDDERKLAAASCYKAIAQVRQLSQPEE